MPQNAAKCHRISTHAPRTGSDAFGLGTIRAGADFNPRSPHGERRLAGAGIANFGTFQPTLPARGATDGFRHDRRGVQISTHAPRTGSDGLLLGDGNAERNFNPRSPHGERHPKWIHFPVSSAISTHAPRTGSDAQIADGSITDANFNPRSPHGERHDAYGAGVARQSNFNPRSPHGERPGGTRTYKSGRDFNPRSPHGERQSAPDADSRRERISTHAPRTGSDEGFLVPADGGLLFQPTLPARGATTPSSRTGRPRRDFNPRSPHGERRGC